MQIRADVDTLRAQPRLSDRGVRRLEVRGGDLVPGALPRAQQPPQAARRALGELAPQAAAPGVLLKARCALVQAHLAQPAALAAAAHRSPRHSGRPNVNASACWPHIRSRRNGARLASSSTRETSLSNSASASGPHEGTLTVT